MESIKLDSVVIVRKKLIKENQDEINKYSQELVENNKQVEECRVVIEECRKKSDEIKEKIMDLMDSANLGIFKANNGTIFRKALSKCKDAEDEYILRLSFPTKPKEKLDNDEVEELEELEVTKPVQRKAKKKTKVTKKMIKKATEFSMKRKK